MIKLKHIPYLLRAQREHRLGDFAILKADLLGAKANDAIAPQLEAVTGYYPPIDLDALLQLPQDSFGYAYAHHMKTNQLTPLNVSPALDQVARRNVFALRYAVTHDIFHFEDHWSDSLDTVRAELGLVTQRDRLNLT